MSFRDIKYLAEIATLVKEYVTAMKTVKQSNIVNREMKLAIGDEVQALFHPIVNVTKHAAEETRKELAPMKKTLTDIDGALLMLDHDRIKNTNTTFGVYKRQDGQLSMGNKVVRLDGNAITIDGIEYKLTLGLLELIKNKHPRPRQYNSKDYITYKSLVAQIKVKSFPNARPHPTLKWKHMIRKMVIFGKRIEEEGESEDTDDTDRVESWPDIASIGDIDRTPPGVLTSDSDISSPGILSPDSGISSPSPVHTRSHRKAKETKDRETFYKKGDGVGYLPGDINGLTK